MKNAFSQMRSVFWHNEQSKQLLLNLLAFCTLVFASQISIHLKPVPLTFQSATVILIGMLYGSKRGTQIVGAYLIAGACGLPVFADFSAGIYTLFGPTGGYLIGFVPAAFISGYLMERGFAKNVLTSFIAACLGTSVIFLLGISVLSIWVGWHQAIQFGLMPFILSEPIKLFAAAGVVPYCWEKN